MVDIKTITIMVESVTQKYENGDLTKEEYLELVQDINTSNLVANTAKEVEDLANLNRMLNNIVTGLSLVA
jgi:hypothetical protein